jgi:hypothetical protein
METPGDILENFRCVVCFELAQDSVECLLCGNIFCKMCVNNIKCPLCRNHSTYKDSTFARKIINNLPISCSGCKSMTTQGTLEKHLLECSERVFKCKAPNCDFSGKKEEFYEHISSSHLIEVLNDFDYNEASKKTNYLTLFNGKVNGNGKSARRGGSGRFYCGEKSDIVCSGCDGNCGPNSGCQCTYCLKLDIEFNKLSPGFILNHSGVLCQLINDKFFCGIRLGNNVFCSPDHQPCNPCSRTGSVPKLVSYVTAMVENSIKK